MHRPRRGLVTAGAITFGVSWGIAASVSLLNDSCTSCGSNSTDYFWIPVAGPLVVASREGGSDTGLLLLWSAAEAAGIIMFVVGIIGRDVMEYRVAQRGPTLTLAPLLARNASGLGLAAHW